MAGRMLRSMPTIAPTNALTRTSSENCARFSRRPRRMVARASGLPAVVTRKRRLPTAEVEAQHAFHLHGLRRDVGELVDKRLARERKHGVPPLLEGDRAGGLATHPGAAGGPREMRRVDLDVVREGQQLAWDAVVEHARVLPDLPGQVRTADRADEERVAREYEPRIGPAPKVGDQERDAIRGVPGGVEHLDPGVAQLDLLAVDQRRERKSHLRRLVQAVVGTGEARERRATRTMVGVDMRIDHVRDAHALRRRERGVRLDVPLLWIDDRALAQAATAEEIGCAAGFEVVIGPKDHG